MRSVQKVSSHVLWNIETFIEEDTRYKKYCTWDNDASVPFKGGTLGPDTVLQLLSAALSYFPESHWRSEMSSLSMVTLVLGKARNSRAPNLGCWGAESPGSWIFADCSPCMFNVFRCSTCCRLSRTWIPFNRFSTIFEAFVPLLFVLRSLHRPWKLSESFA